MRHQDATSRLRLVVVGLVLFGAGTVGLLALEFGLPATFTLLRAGLLAVLYIVVPIVVVAGLLRVYFSLNAWRQ